MDFPRLWKIAGVFLVLMPAFVGAADDKPVKVQIISTEMPQSWSYGDMTNHRLVWDAKKQQFRADVTFSDQFYSSDVNPQPDTEVYQCPFPGVRFDEASQLFIARTAKGKTVPVAQRKKTLFGTQIELLPTSRVTIYNFSGKLIVVLSGTTDQAYATGMNKWIVHPKGWYLQNAY